MYRLKAVFTDRRELDLEPRHTQHASAQRAAAILQLQGVAF